MKGALLALISLLAGAAYPAGAIAQAWDDTVDRPVPVSKPAPARVRGTSPAVAQWLESRRQAALQAAARARAASQYSQEQPAGGSALTEEEQALRAGLRPGVASPGYAGSGAVAPPQEKPLTETPPGSWLRPPTQEEPKEAGSDVPMATPQYKQDNAFTNDSAFFGGLSKEAMDAAKAQPVDAAIFKPNTPGKKSPEWAKQRPSTYYVEGTEHPGAEDPGGFF